MRHGSGILIKPYTHSSAVITAATEQDIYFDVGSARQDIFDFADLDFERLRLKTSDRPQIIPVNTGIRLYKTLQFHDRQQRG
jgi:hypothetical protein